MKREEDALRLTLGILLALGLESDALAREIQPEQEIVITAARTKLGAKQNPVAAEVIRGDELKRKGIYNVQDALKNAVSLDVTENGMFMAGNQASIRGMGSNRTLVLVDGRRLAGEDSPETMNAYELNRLNINRVDRIEILRGAGSAIWGSDAMGGVINIITKKDKPAGAYAGTRTGSLESSVYGGFSTGPLGKLNLSLDGNLTKVRKRTAGEVTNQHGPRRTISLDGSYQFTEDSGLEFGASFLKEQFSERSVKPRVGRIWDYYDNNRESFYLKYYGADPKNDWEIQSYYSRLGKEGRDRSQWAWTDFNHARYSLWVNEAKDVYAMDAHNTLTYGLEQKVQKAGGTRFGSKNGGGRIEHYLGLASPYATDSVKTYAAYVQDELKLGDRLLVVPSLRLDHHDTFGSEWSPKLGATYTLSKASRLKLNYGRAYRAPSIFELYADFDHTPVPGYYIHVAGNPDLQPEKAVNFDVSLEAEKGKAAGKFTYFHNKVSNLINRYADSFGFNYRTHRMEGLYHYQNVNKAVLQGAEAEAKYGFDKRWSLKANYTYLDARDEAGRRLTGRAYNAGTVELDWTDGKKDPWTAALYTQWFQNYLSDGETGRNRVKDQYTYSLTNFVVTKDIGNLSLYAGVDNIFNKTFSDNAALWNDGRVWRAGVHWKF